jgi:hypothetical protein
VNMTLIGLVRCLLTALIIWAVAVWHIWWLLAVVLVLMTIGHELRVMEAYRLSQRVKELEEFTTWKAEYDRRVGGAND